jgi:hypothetical protein
MAMDPPLTFWPKYQLSILNSFFIVQIFIFQFLHYGFISSIKAHCIMSFAVAQWEASLPMVQAT